MMTRFLLKYAGLTSMLLAALAAQAALAQPECGSRMSQGRFPILRFGFCTAIIDLVLCQPEPVTTPCVVGFFSNYNSVNRTRCCPSHDCGLPETAPQD